MANFAQYFNICKENADASAVASVEPAQTVADVNAPAQAVTPAPVQDANTTLATEPQAQPVAPVAQGTAPAAAPGETAPATQPVQAEVQPTPAAQPQEVQVAAPQPAPAQEPVAQQAVSAPQAPEANAGAVAIGTDACKATGCNDQPMGNGELTTETKPAETTETAPAAATAPVQDANTTLVPEAQAAPTAEPVTSEQPTQPTEGEAAKAEETPVESEVEIAEQFVEVKHELDETCNSIECASQVIDETQAQLANNEKLLENPAEVTPTDVVIATESFKTSLRLLGISDTYSKSLSFVNSEDLKSNPAQMLSIVHIDMEGFVAHAEDVLSALFEKVKEFITKVLEIMGIFEKNYIRKITEFKAELNKLPSNSQFEVSSTLLQSLENSCSKFLIDSEYGKQLQKTTKNILINQETFIRDINNTIKRVATSKEHYKQDSDFYNDLTKSFRPSIGKTLGYEGNSRISTPSITDEVSTNYHFKIIESVEDSRRKPIETYVRSFSDFKSDAEGALNNLLQTVGNKEGLQYLMKAFDKVSDNTDFANDNGGGTSIQESLRVMNNASRQIGNILVRFTSLQRSTINTVFKVISALLAAAKRSVEKAK